MKIVTNTYSQQAEMSDAQVTEKGTNSPTMSVISQRKVCACN